jgi:hypothetical protein
MIMNYTWKLDRIKRKTTSDVTNAIVQTYWTKTGTDDAGNEGTFSGATPFPLETVDSENFIAYEDLTSETILGWIQGVVVGDYEEHVNGQIAKMIDATVSPENEDNEADFPWTTSTETPEPEV